MHILLSCHRDLEFPLLTLLPLSISIHSLSKYRDGRLSAGRQRPSEPFWLGPHHRILTSSDHSAFTLACTLLTSVFLDQFVTVVSRGDLLKKRYPDASANTLVHVRLWPPPVFPLLLLPGGEDRKSRRRGLALVRRL